MVSLTSGEPLTANLQPGHSPMVSHFANALHNAPDAYYRKNSAVKNVEKLLESQLEDDLEMN